MPRRRLDELKGVLGDDLTNSDFFDVIDASPFPAYDGGSKVTPWKNSTAKYAALMKIGLAGRPGERGSPLL